MQTGPLVKDSARAFSKCSKTYTRAMFHAGARSLYRHTTLPAKKVRRVRKFVRCQRGGARSRRIVRWHLKRYKRHWEARRRVAALTPYRGPNGSRWAIPWGIVACESGGSWSAFNASGAAGPYQIMPEWGRPWPANTASARLRHHQLAARIYNGGAGASNWVCKG